MGFQPISALSAAIVDEWPADEAGPVRDLARDRCDADVHAARDDDRRLVAPAPAPVTAIRSTGCRRPSRSTRAAAAGSNGIRMVRAKSLPRPAGMTPKAPAGSVRAACPAMCCPVLCCSVLCCSAAVCAGSCVDPAIAWVNIPARALVRPSPPNATTVSPRRRRPPPACEHAPCSCSRTPCN